jgi:hypothetical protein
MLSPFDYEPETPQEELQRIESQLQYYMLTAVLKKLNFRTLKFYLELSPKNTITIKKYPIEKQFLDKKIQELLPELSNMLVCQSLTENQIIKFKELTLRDLCKNALTKSYLIDYHHYTKNPSYAIENIPMVAKATIDKRMRIVFEDY